MINNDAAGTSQQSYDINEIFKDIAKSNIEIKDSMDQSVRKFLEHLLSSSKKGEISPSKVAALLYDLSKIQAQWYINKTLDFQEGIID